MSKKAIQLSLNFLVITIISIVIFGMGIYLMNKFLGHADDTVFQWEERQKKEIEDLLSQGKVVAIPFDSKTIQQKKSDSFGVGIMNILDESPVDFRIDVIFSKAYDGPNVLCDHDDTSGCGVDPDTWLRSSTQMGGPLNITKTIKRYDQEKFLVGMRIGDAVPGIYTFDLRVKYFDTDWEMYGTPHKLIVNVP